MKYPLRSILSLVPLTGLALLALTSPPGVWAQPAQDGFDDLGSFDDPAELEPGVLPQDTSPEARALWLALCDATLVPESKRVPVKAFDLWFDLRVRTKGSHDVNNARFLFKAPNYISSELSQENRLMRGPRGDWLVTKDQDIKLDNRDMVQDRRQLDDTLNIAHNFVKLTDPQRMRIAKLALAQAPLFLPQDPKLIARAAPLEWLEIESPDLRLFRDGVLKRSNWDPDPNYRGLLGLDPKTRLPQFVLINEARQADDLTRALLVSFEKYRPRDGYQIPHRILTYRFDTRAGKRRFKTAAEVEMSLFPGKGSLNPAELGDEHFAPQERR